MLTVGSLFSGIGGFDLGLERAGMRVVFQAERDPFCRRVLAKHWPGIPCFDDVRSVGRGPWPRRGRTGRARGASESARVSRWIKSGNGVDLLCGGFPCQDLSVAGRRAGLAGERSGLFFEFARIADELVRPGGWVIVENVPGLLSSAAGRDFAIVLRTLGDIGFHDLAWRVLDSRYFGVPQRRRRVFIVGRRAGGSGAREVLLEPESGGGNFAPSREAGSRAAASLSRGSANAGVSAPGRRQEDDENIVNALDRQGGGPDDNSAQAGHLVAAPLVSRSSRGRAQTLSAGHNTDGHIVRAYSGHGEGESRIANAVTQPSHGSAWKGNSSDTFVCAPSDPDGVRAAPGLSGRVDDPPPDGPRYAAMGNAVTVGVAEWIGRRIIEWERAAA